MSRPPMHAGTFLQKAEARPVSRPRDRQEREAERAAQVVARGDSVAGWSFSSVAPSAPVQRQEVVKEKTDEEKKKEATSKVVEALQETPQAKALKEKVLEEPRVKALKEAATSTPGLIVGGAVIAGGVAALGAAKQPLPFQAPEIPLDKLRPGLSAKLKLDGPVNSPTFVGVTLTYKEQGPKGKKTAESDRIAADIARLRREREMFKPESQKQAEKKQEKELLDAWIKSQSGLLPGLTVPLKGAPSEETVPKKEEEQAPVQPAPATASAAMPATAEVDDSLATPGRPLDPATRRAMEARFGYDFSGVRVHDDARAWATAADINAAAFTVGQDIVFGPGRYAPSTGRGRELLAHELAHTIQQRGTRSKAKGPPIAPGSTLERSAAKAGLTAASGQPVTQALGRSGVAIARQAAKPPSTGAPVQPLSVVRLPPSLRVRIVAHASPRWRSAVGARAADEANERLSVQRAETVKRIVDEELRKVLGPGARVEYEIEYPPSDEPEGIVVVGSEARGSRETLVEAKGNRRANEASQRRVDVYVDRVDRVQEQAWRSTKASSRMSLTTRWWIEPEVSATASLGGAVGMLSMKLTNADTGRWASVQIVGGGGGSPGVGTSTSVGGGPVSFRTDEPMGFGDFENIWVRYTSFAVGLTFFGYEKAYLSFMGLGSGAEGLNVGGWNVGAQIKLGGSVISGRLKFTGIGPPSDDYWVPPGEDWVPFTAKERFGDLHTAMFETGKFELLPKPLDDLRAFIQHSAEQFRSKQPIPPVSVP